MTVRKRSCGKVMIYTYLSVSHSVHGGVCPVHAGIHTPMQTPPPGQTPQGQTPHGQTPPGGHLPLDRHPQADTPLEAHPQKHNPMEAHPPKHTPIEAHTPEAHLPWKHPFWKHTPLEAHPTTPSPPPGDGHCSRRYASYWNAFLFYIVIVQSEKMFKNDNAR